jgi:uncharacterized membrane protein
VLNALWQRAAIVTLVTLLAVAVVLAADPLHLGGVRVAGVSLLWWYAGAAGPLAAVVVTIVALALRS